MIFEYLIYWLFIIPLFYFLKDKELFDLSDCEGKFHDDKNKKVIGKFKEEMGLSKNPIIEFVGHKSKMYSVLTKKYEKKTCKGINKNITQKVLTHELYKHVLFSGSEIYNNQRNIRSFKHNIYSIESNKKSLSAFDDKKYILADGISTRCYGHYLNNG